MTEPVDICPIAAFRDNYIWCLSRGNAAVVVDPGDAAPVLAHLERERLTLAGILATHHHADHIGGIDALLASRRVPVWAPRREPAPSATVLVGDGDRVELTGIGVTLEVLDVPGHTAGHVAYYGANAVFCGDTLFSAGCGRLFEGTPAQMHASLSRLAALPGETRVYCGHEYTQSNLRFALEVEPDNAAVAARAAEVARLRDAGLPTLPSTIEIERATNPFLRPAEPGVAAAAARHAGRRLDDPVDVFAAIRAWKDVF